MNRFDRLSINQLIIYVSVILFFILWLRPLQVVTDTGNIYIFEIFVVASFLFYFFNVRLLYSFMIKAFLMFYFIQDQYFYGSFFQIDWLKWFWIDVRQNIVLIVNQNWLELTNSFRTFIFYIILWLICYIVYFSLEKANRLFPFFLLTVIYLSILDTFTTFNGHRFIIVAIAIGFLSISILHFQRLKQKEGFHISFVKPVFFLVVMVSGSVLLGSFLPKQGPQWPDPVPYVKSALQGDLIRGQQVKKIGYGTDDSRLGGPFIMDETPVYKVITEEPHYWRVETKDFYTGKGWEESKKFRLRLQDKDQISLKLYDENIEKNEKVAVVNRVSNEKAPFLIYSPELQSVHMNRDIDLKLNPFTEKFETFKENKRTSLEYYSLTYDLPAVSIEQLQTAPETVHSLEKIYTQLPESLPERVYDLAEEITKDKTTRYDKVKAIEQYFFTNDFVYETKDVAVPDENEDYVDQFLFETKKGYCDNYSTSMVVLLRTLEIPARWVKGFTQGEYLKTNEDGKRIYEIQNANAHSWVEVYFSEVGWVPFEPTIGFSNPFHIYTEADQELEEEPIEEEEMQEEEEVNEEEIDEENKGGALLSFNGAKYLLILLILIISTSIMLYVTRKRWMKQWILLKYKKRTDREAFQDAYHQLLKLLQRNGIVREKGMTLREFALVVDHKLNTNEMEQLTKKYEQVLYAGKDPQVEWGQALYLWENIVKRILS